EDARAKKDEVRDPRQEAVVKGITPAQPAPLPAAASEPAPLPPPSVPARVVPAADVQEGSWLSRMLGWFRARPSETGVATPTSPSPQRAPTAASAGSPDRARDTRGEARRDGGRGRDERRGEGRNRRDERRGDARGGAGRGRDAAPRAGHQARGDDDR